jgi:tetratricopeptide (TPR) repeat protein
MTARESILARIAYLAIILQCSSIVLPRDAQSQTSTTTRVLGTAQSDEEFDAYREVLTASDARAITVAAEKFLKNYPSSGLGPYVHQSAVRAYYQLGEMAQAAQHGEIALQDLPGNAVLLSLVSAAYLEETEWEKAADRARAALAAITKLEAPAGVDRAAWQAQADALASNVHLTLGSALLEMSRQATQAPTSATWLKEATSELRQTLASNPRSDLASFRLASALDVAQNTAGAIHYYAWTVVLAASRAQAAQIKLTELCRSDSRLMNDAIASARSDIQLNTNRLRGRK